MSVQYDNISAGRMNWLDGARIAAAFCIIGIHASSDHIGGAFKNAENHDRVFPVLMRSVSEMASTEFFILISLFLLSMKLSKSDVSSRNSYASLKAGLKRSSSMSGYMDNSRSRSSHRNKGEATAVSRQIDKASRRRVITGTAKAFPPAFLRRL